MIDDEVDRSLTSARVFASSAVSFSYPGGQVK